ncbi:MAG: 4-alpha-glucanotransferase [Myxococcota bacterium]|nr:4-alpha-glucanotransferase [Myxococcota bacterium]
MRRAAVLLHPTALPSSYGIGDLGPEARHFVDWLQRSGASAWQVLPLSAPGPDGCPYSSPASQIGDPLLISLEDLAREGLLFEDEIAPLLEPLSPERPPAALDFSALKEGRRPLLERAARRLLATPSHRLHAPLQGFRSETPGLADTSLFRVLHRERRGAAWWTWEEALRDRDLARITREGGERAEALAFEETIAFFFEHQWAELRGYAADRSVSIIGDLPIYVAGDSAEVWTRPDLFELHDGGRPFRVAGVPPDPFAPLGQRWGNPLYDWERHAEEGYRWWIDRTAWVMARCDLVRLDHFRGFASYYAIPAESPDARTGAWLEGPGAALFSALTSALGALPLIAEDLGFIDAPVEALRRAVGLPSMRVLQFGLDGEPGNPHAPGSVPEDAVVYTATPHTPPRRGWWTRASEEERARAAQILNCSGENFVDALVRVALDSPASWAVLPLQDLLGLGDEARTNTPGTRVGNWSWRCAPGLMSEGLADRVACWIRQAGPIRSRVTLCRRSRPGSGPGPRPRTAAPWCRAPAGSPPWWSLRPAP